MRKYSLLLLIATLIPCMYMSCGTTANSSVVDGLLEVASHVDFSSIGHISRSEKSKKGKTKNKITDGTPGAVCPLCYGEKRIVKNQPIEVSGDDKKIKCTECRKKFRPSEGHSHIDCPLCQHY